MLTSAETTVDDLGFEITRGTLIQSQNISLHIGGKELLSGISLNISKAEIGFGSDFNEVSIVYKEKNKQNETISKRKKSEIAEIITDKVVENFIS